MSKTPLADSYPWYRVTVKDGNAIEAESTEGVTGLVLYLNEKIVDMKEPVTVVAAGKQLYKGKPEPELRVRLRDGHFPAIERKTLLHEHLEALRSRPSETAGRCAKRRDCRRD